MTESSSSQALRSMACWSLALTVVLAPGSAAAPGDGAVRSAPRLESMQIEVWPEYDRPAVLVIMKGTLAGEVSLPVTLSLRIPASSGGPSAVAYAIAQQGQLLNLRHDLAVAADFITLRFTTPERFFHVEFYDPLPTAAPERTYRYVWPGDMPVGALNVVLQEPAAAGNISVQPELGQWSNGADGLRYRSAQLGPVKQGTTMPVQVSYAKSDPRTSKQILGLDAPQSDPRAATSPEEREAFRLFLASGAFALLVVGSSLIYFLWWRRRPRPGVGASAGAGFCTKCGRPLAAGDRFCSKCGTPRA